MYKNCITGSTYHVTGKKNLLGSMQCRGASWHRSEERTKGSLTKGSTGYYGRSTGVKYAKSDGPRGCHVRSLMVAGKPQMLQGGNWHAHFSLRPHCGFAANFKTQLSLHARGEWVLLACHAWLASLVEVVYANLVDARTSYRTYEARATCVVNSSEGGRAGYAMCKCSVCTIHVQSESDHRAFNHDSMIKSKL